MSNRDYIDSYLARMGAVLDDLPRPEIDAAIDLLFEAWRSGKAVYLAGNGGSASTASHFACDLAKWTRCEGKPPFRALALTDNMPLFSALMNDEGPDSVYAEQVEAWIGEGDVLVLISVHGGSGAGNAGAWSGNLLKALRAARERGARTLGLSGFDGGALKRLADLCIVVPVDSTPQVESLHLAVHHLICDRLRQRIAAA